VFFIAPDPNDVPSPSDVLSILPSIAAPLRNGNQMTSLASPEMRDLAMRLLASEAGDGEGSIDAAAGKVCGKLGDLVTDLAGAEGFHSLVSRALSLSRSEVTWLSEISIDHEGNLLGMECRREISREEVVQGETLFIAKILGLLGHIIGQNLVMQLIKEIWPSVFVQQDLGKKATRP
jgi:hypothetical protein